MIAATYLLEACDIDCDTPCLSILATYPKYDTEYARLMKGRDVFVTLKLQTKDVWYITTKELSKYLKCHVHVMKVNE